MAGLSSDQADIQRIELKMTPAVVWLSWPGRLHHFSHGGRAINFVEPSAGFRTPGSWMVKQRPFKTGLIQVVSLGARL
jgi:hypothetical protein